MSNEKEAEAGGINPDYDDSPGWEKAEIVRLHRSRERARQERDQLAARIYAIRAKLEQIVCTEGEDAGVVLLSEFPPTHVETINGTAVTVYDLEYFTPLGEALMDLWKLTQEGNT